MAKNWCQKDSQLNVLHFLSLSAHDCFAILMFCSLSLLNSVLAAHMHSSSYKKSQRDTLKKNSLDT